MRLWYPFTQIGQTISGTAATYSALPPASSYTGMFYRVTTATGVWPVNRHEAGIYFSDGSTWIYVADFTEHDDAIEIANNPSGLTYATGATVQAAIGQLDAAIINKQPLSTLLTLMTQAEIDDGNSGSSKTINFSSSLYHLLTLTANCTLTFTAPTAPCFIVLRIVQGASAYTITWPTIKWAGGITPQGSTANGAEDTYIFYYNGTSYRQVGVQFGEA